MARCDNILRSLGIKFKSATEIKFLSNMGMKVLQDVRRFHKVQLPSTSLGIKLTVFTQKIFLQTA